MNAYLLLLCLLLCSCTAAKPPVDPAAVVETPFVVNEELAKNLIHINSDYVPESGAPEYIDVDDTLDMMNRDELIRLRQIIKGDLDKNPRSLVLPPESITAAWQAYDLVYSIDRRLGQLEYDKIIEGEFLGCDTSLFGCLYCTFKDQDGKIIDIFITSATQYRQSPEEDDDDSLGEGDILRLFLNERDLSGYIRREVVMMDILGRALKSTN